MYWVIDGYNLMRQSQHFGSLELKNAEKAKKDFLSFLNYFCEITGERLRVYFDLYSRLSQSTLKENHGQIEVVYSRGSYTADEEIILHLKKHAPQVFCVSSDREIQEGAKAARASFLSSQDFEAWVWKMIDAVEGMGEEEKVHSKRGSSYSPPKEKKKAWSRMRRLYETL